MKRLIFILLAFISLKSTAQIYDTLPTGSKPYGNQLYISPTGLIIGGTGSAKFRVLGTKKYVDSLLDLKQGKVGYIKLSVKSTGENKTYVPTANTNAARGVILQQAFTDMLAGDNLEIGPGIYYVTTALTLKDSVNVQLRGSTIYHTNTSIDIFVANNVNSVSITGNGLVRGSGSTTANPTTSEAGLRLSGECYNPKISGITFSGFSGVGIYFGSATSSTLFNPFVNGSIENCNITNNNLGIYTASEHIRLENITVTKNKLGIYAFGGNLQLNNSYISYNVRGIEIGGSSGNAGHGIIGNSSIIHNSQMGIKFDALTIGMALNGNKFAGVYPAATTDSTIVINASRGVHFTGGQMLSPMQIVLTGTFPGYNSIRGAFFYSGDTTLFQPNIVGTTLQKGFLRIEQSSYLDKLVTPLGTPIDILEGGTGNTTGAAVKLQTPRNINSVAFDGTSNITIFDASKLPLTGGTLSGALNGTSLNFSGGGSFAGNLNALQIGGGVHYLGTNSSYTGRWVDGGSYVSLDTYNGSSIAKELRLQGSSVSVTTAPVNPNDVLRKQDVPTITNGTYTPTISNTTNISASTIYQCLYSRVGNIVTYSGTVSVTTPATGLTQFELTLPISSAFTSVKDASGTMSGNAGNFGVVKSNSSSSGNIFVAFSSSIGGITPQDVYFSCQYIIK